MALVSATERLKALRVSDVMNRGVVQLRASSSLEDAARGLTEHNLSSAPVVDETGRCIGMLSAVDFLQQRANPAGSIRAAMSRSVQCIGWRETLLRAAQVMCVQHVHRLPVIDEAGGVVGIVSTMDIVAALVNAIDEMDVSSLSG